MLLRRVAGFELLVGTDSHKRRRTELYARDRMKDGGVKTGEKLTAVAGFAMDKGSAKFVHVTPSGERGEVELICSVSVPRLPRLCFPKVHGLKISSLATLGSGLARLWIQMSPPLDSALVWDQQCVTDRRAEPAVALKLALAELCMEQREKSPAMV
ncbi:C-X-C motif chemokine 13 [Sarotherodon galilaeus]